MSGTLHPGTDQLRSLLDGEPTGPDAGAWTGHVDACASCREELALLRELRQAVREVSTVALPPDTWERILERRAAGETTILPLPAAPATRRAWGRAVLAGGAGRRAAAAVLLLGVAGVASATLPGSPVRDWWESLRSSRSIPAGDVAAPSEARAPAPAAAREAVTALSIDPADGTVRILVNGSDARTRIRVRISDVPQARVEATGAAAGALLRTGTGRIEVVGAGPGEVRVELPRRLRRATLTVDGTPYLRKDGTEVHVLAPGADTVDAELVFRAGH